MRVEPCEFRFRLMVAADLPMLPEWLSRPDVAEWWGESGSLADLTDEFTPALTGSPSHRAYVYCVDGRDAGFVQSGTSRRHSTTRDGGATSTIREFAASTRFSPTWNCSVAE